ncbi:ATP-binding protein [Marinicella rhabdoformis]|uniref:ATP-binding protein n=1 Tax=Marinicella rhabdoformis TaxID=2580566 RepID=UPI001C555B13|nr:ATP-binding protein [Marinicella rhabdoformis]
MSARHYGVLQGLPDQAALDIVQDAHQQIWISTSNGLTRFNGEAFEVYRNQPGNENSILGNSISSIALVGQDMWFLIEEMGLSQYLSKQKQFKHKVSGKNKAPAQLLNSDIFAITSDSDDRLYVFQFNGGISVKEMDSEQFTHYTDENTSWLESLMFFDAEVSAENQLWAITLDGKALHWDLNNNNQRWFQVVDDARAGANGLYDVTIDANNQVWLSGYAGVFQFDEEKGVFSSAVSEKQITNHFGKHVSVRSSYHDRRGILWLATLEGLLRFEDKELHSVTLMTTTQKHIKNIYVNKVFEDHENNLWVLTMEHGVFVVGNQWRHQNILALTQEGESFKAAAVHAQAGSDTLYLSHEFSPKIEVIENSKGKPSFDYRVWQENSEASQLKPNVILAEEQGLWIGGISGLYWQAVDKSVQNVALQSEASDKAFTVNKMLMGDGNDLWVHAHGLDQLWRIDRRTPSIQIALPIKAADLVDMQWLSKDHMLLAHDHQLWLYDTASKKWHSLYETPQFINNIAVAEKKLWLVVNGVLKLMNWQGNTLHSLPFDWPKDLSHFVIKQMSQDPLGRLWLISENGLVVYDPKKGHWRLFDTDTGLPSPRVIAVYHRPDGSHWLVSSKGVVHISDDLFATKPQSVVLNIESILLNDIAIKQTQNFKLDYQYGLIQFQYALASYNQPNSHRFEYRLTAQGPWQTLGNAHVLSLHDLTPGEYQLAMRGKSEQSLWSEPITVNFVVKPPWWYSQNAWIAYGLILIVLVWLMKTFLRKRWLYRQTLAEAFSRQQFAETQLDLTSSLVGALETEALLEKIKKVISNQVKVESVLVAFWNEEGQWSAFSEKIPLEKQLSLKVFAQRMQQNNETHSFHDNGKTYFLTVWFNHSDKRFGFIQLANNAPFSRNDLVKAKACATQSSLALENARLYSEVNSLAEKAQAASQAKSEFLAQVSHEVRTPMHGILGMNQLLLASGLSQDQRSYSEAVAESGQHLLKIINDILDFSKIEAGRLSIERQTFDLIELLDEVLGLFSATAKQKGLMFYLDYQSGMAPSRIGDALRVKQVLMNLLSNAFKFTAKGHVVLTVRQVQDSVTFSVDDTGTGIAEAHQKFLFEPFTQADSSITRTHGGTGLGLSIVKQLCELMGGTVTVASKLDQGSTFQCILDIPAGESITPLQKNITPCVILVADNTAVGNAVAAQCQLTGLTVKYSDLSEIPTDYQSTIMVVLTTESATQKISEEVELLVSSGHQVIIVKPSSLVLVPLREEVTIFVFPLKTSQLKSLFLNDSSQQAKKAALNDKYVSGHKKDILVLEDNAINQELMRHLLLKAGHKVHMFDHAKDALAALQGGLICDLMLVDYHLPDVNGIAFINQARSMLPDVPCAILTADVSDELLALCHEHKIKDVFTKPMDLNRLDDLLNA